MHVLTRLTALAAATCLTVAGLGAPSVAEPSAPHPARADRWVTTPGPFTGYGFDTCAAPDQATMDAWRTSSPYAAVGIYTGGTNRLCEQPHLTADWVRTQAAAGWHLMPVHVGPQAACTAYPSVMAADRPTAEAQGRAEAAAAISSVQALAIGPGSTLYYDLEDYDITDQGCRQAALSFLSGWTRQLHTQGYRSGVYSNVAAAITSLDLANNLSPGSYAMPDDIWFAWGNGAADTKASTWVTTSEWDDHQRAHQYVLDVEQTYGGVTQTVDLNWVDVDGGSTAPKDKKTCRGVQVDQRRYPRLRPGSRGKHVEALQCVLRKQHLGKPATSGRYDKKTARAVRKAQRKLDLKVTGKVTRQTWTALHARGSRPLLKVGSTGDPVRRLQRALTSTLGKRVRIRRGDGRQDPRCGDQAPAARAPGPDRQRRHRDLGTAGRRRLRRGGAGHQLAADTGPHPCGASGGWRGLRRRHLGRHLGRQGGRRLARDRIGGLPGGRHRGLGPVGRVLGREHVVLVGRDRLLLGLVRCAVAAPAEARDRRTPVGVAAAGEGGDGPTGDELEGQDRHHRSDEDRRGARRDALPRQTAQDAAPVEPLVRLTRFVLERGPRPVEVDLGLGEVLHRVLGRARPTLRHLLGGLPHPGLG